MQTFTPIITALAPALLLFAAGCSSGAGSKPGSDSTSAAPCDPACGPGQACVNGTCTWCGQGLTACGTVCTNLAQDPGNCGGCGLACASGQACVNGMCSGGAASTTGGAAATTGGAAATGTGGSTPSSSGTGGSTTQGTGGGSTVNTSGCTEEEALFSFFVTSYEAIQRMSGSPDGFGGDLGGLAGADALCQAIAEYSTPCAANRQWRAFLSTVAGPVHAKDRIGPGPWYDRLGRVLAMNLTDLISERPVGADSAIANDLPNEYGVPNHDPDGTGEVDNHDTLTGSAADGTVFSTDPGDTCQDWTSSVGADGTPRVGHTWGTAMGGGGTFPGGGSFPGGGGDGSMNHWISALTEAGCAPGVNLIQNGGPNPSNPTVGSGGGYGGWYCFALAL